MKVKPVTYGAHDLVVPEPLYLWRFFGIKKDWFGYFLTPVTATYVFYGGTAVAECCRELSSSRHAKELAPYPGCTCGFYGYSSLKTLVDSNLDGFPRNYVRRLKPMNNGVVIGMVKCWGTCIEHQDGYRVQYMKAVHLWVHTAASTPKVMRSLRKNHEAEVESHSFELEDLKRIPFYANPISYKPIKGEVLNGLLG